MIGPWWSPRHRYFQPCKADRMDDCVETFTLLNDLISSKQHDNLRNAPVSIWSASRGW